MMRKTLYNPAGKIAENSMVECIFDYIGLHIDCRFNKNSLLRCYFLEILPAAKINNFDSASGMANYSGRGK